MQGQDDPDLDENGLTRRSRTSEKLEREANEAAMADLVKRMIALGADRLRSLDLPEEVLDAVEDARKIKSAPALARQSRRLRGFLRDLPWATYLRKLDAKKAGIAFDEEDGREEIVRWSTDLPLHGDRGLGRFLEIYPTGDRKRLRTLAMNVVRSPEAKRTKARRQLEMLVEATISESKKVAIEKERRGVVTKAAPKPRYAPVKSTQRGFLGYEARSEEAAKNEASRDEEE